LDSHSGELDIVNAGQNPILLFRKRRVIGKIDTGGGGLGMFNLGIPYSGQKLIMNPGDRLFLYTDGIPEAMNENEEEYSDERMIDFLESHSEQSANKLIDVLEKDVKNFTGSAEQSDDITALYLIRID
jgi:sigma-B regulation protein RsbU (phosphoserine phosphatase)